MGKRSDTSFIISADPAEDPLAIRGANENLVCSIRTLKPGASQKIV